MVWSDALDFPTGNRLAGRLHDQPVEFGIGGHDGGKAASLEPAEQDVCEFGGTLPVVIGNGLGHL